MDTRPPGGGGKIFYVQTLYIIKSRGGVGWALALTLSKNVLGGQKGVSPFGWASADIIYLFIEQSGCSSVEILWSQNYTRMDGLVVLRVRSWASDGYKTGCFNR